MSYLLTQMLFYLLGALLLGLLLGWILWGRRGIDAVAAQSEIDRLRDESSQLRRNLEACSRARAELEGRIAETLSAGAKQAATADISPIEPVSAEPIQDQPAAALMAKSAKATATKRLAAEKPTGTAKATKSKTAAPAKKPGPVVQPDDLRRIVGIGPVNERLLHGEGVHTFAQIAGWSVADVKHMEEVLQFDGRIERERWIEQAMLLAAGDEVEFAKRFPTAASGKNT